MSLLETAYSWVLCFNPPSHSVFQLVDPTHLHLGRLLTHSLTIAIHLLFPGLYTSIVSFPLLLSFHFGGSVWHSPKLPVARVSRLCSGF